MFLIRAGRLFVVSCLRVGLFRSPFDKLRANGGMFHPNPYARYMDFNNVFVLWSSIDRSFSFKGLRDPICYLSWLSSIAT